MIVGSIENMYMKKGSMYAGKFLMDQYIAI